MKNLLTCNYVISLIGSCLLLTSCSNSENSFQPQSINENKFSAQSVEELIKTPLCEITEVAHKRGTCKVIVQHTFSRTETNSYDVKVSSLSDCTSTEDFLWRREQTIFAKEQLNNILFNQNASYDVNFTNNMTTAVIKTPSSEYDVTVNLKNTNNGLDTLSFIKSESDADSSELSRELCMDKVNPEIRSFCSEARMIDLGESVAEVTSGTVGERSKNSLRSRLSYALFRDDICYFTDRDYLFDVFLDSGNY